MRIVPSIFLPSLCSCAFFFLASCGVDWSRRATVIYDSGTLLRAEPRAGSAALKTLHRFDEVDLTGDARSEGQAKFLGARQGKLRGWVYAGVVMPGTVAGIVTGKEKAAFKDKPDGTPVGFIDPATLVLVKRGKKLARPQEILVREGNLWKSAWVDPDSLSIDGRDMEIFTKVLPTVDEYLAKAAQGDERKQLELALAYLGEVESKYMKSEFYPETLARRKAELRDRLGEGGSAKEKVLDTDTNNTYEIKK